MANVDQNLRQKAPMRSRTPTWRTLALAMLGAVLVGGAGAKAQTTNLPAGTQTGMAHSGTIGPGKMIVPVSSETPFTPTAAQIAAHEQAMAAKAKHVAPPVGPHTTAAQVSPNGGPPTTESWGMQTAGQTPAAQAFTVYKKSLINSNCSGCAPSSVNEPSAANSGKVVVETSNWNIAYTLTEGASSITWLNQSPYSLSPGFCCDTEVLYNADRDIFILLLNDYTADGASTNGITLSITRGFSPTAWCTYKFTGASFGEGATDLLDFPKMAMANNNLFVTWNDYGAGGAFNATQIVRMPLDSLQTCSTVNYTYVTRSTEFTFGLTQQGAHDQFWWVSNWFLDGTVDGSNLRIFHWPDNSGTYFFNTVAINPFNFTTAACGSPNWCSRLDARYEAVVITPAEFRAEANSAFAGDQILEVASTAGPSSFSNGNNYIVYNYFKLNSLAYIGNDQTYSASEPFAYPACAANTKGYVGCSASVGLNNPGGIIILQDYINPTQPWAINFVIPGINGATEWGDYTFTSPWYPNGGAFQTVLWNVNGTTVQPYYIVFGRTNDGYDLTRWRSY